MWRSKTWRSKTWRSKTWRSKTCVWGKRARIKGPKRGCYRGPCVVKRQHFRRRIASFSCDFEACSLRARACVQAPCAQHTCRFAFTLLSPLRMESLRSRQQFVAVPRAQADRCRKACSQSAFGHLAECPKECSKGPSGSLFGAIRARWPKALQERTSVHLSAWASVAVLVSQRRKWFL